MLLCKYTLGEKWENVQSSGGENGVNREITEVKPFVETTFPTKPATYQTSPVFKYPELGNSLNSANFQG